MLYKRSFPIPANITILRKDGRPSDANTITLTLDYTKGGAAMFQPGRTIERGYYLDLRATKVEKYDGHSTETFALFATPGFRILLQPVKRASAKVEAALFARIEGLAEAIVNAWLAGDYEETRALVERCKL